MIEADFAVVNCGQLLQIPHDTPDDLGVLQDAALAALKGRIVWIGAQRDLAGQVTLTSGAIVLDARGQVVLPGLVDSHTHIVYAGSRAGEFHERLTGASYATQLGEGRGIHRTVAATRAATLEELVASAQRRMRSCLAHGSTTIEIKSGYGLHLVSEARMLDAISELATEGVPRVVPTFMGAHVVPLEHRASREAYMRELLDTMLPTFAGRAVFCDVFCETKAFSVAESRALLLRARDLGYRLKIHANQLAPSGGAALAAELGAVSADHLDFVDAADLAGLAAAGVVATLLPGCSMTLRTPYPSARPFLAAGVPLALATDCNPGTCACENMQLIIALAVLHMDLTVEQAIRAATMGGAQALGMHHEIGGLEVGKRADLLLLDAASYEELGYRLGTNLVRTVVVDGRVALEADR